MNQRALVALGDGILHGRRHEVDEVAGLNGLALQGRAVLNHDHISALDTALDLGGELGVDLAVLEVAALKGDAVERAEILRRGHNSAGVAVDDKGAFLLQRLFKELVVGERLGRLGQLSDGLLGQRAGAGESEDDAQQAANEFLHKIG